MGSMAEHIVDPPSRKFQTLLHDFDPLHVIKTSTVPYLEEALSTTGPIA